MTTPDGAHADQHPLGRHAAADDHLAQVLEESADGMLDDALDRLDLPDLIEDGEREAAIVAEFEAEADEQVEEDLREKYRQQVMSAIGGWSGMVITAVPPLVFVIVNTLAGLRPGIFAALGAGAAVALYRAVRKQPLQQAATGLAGVAFAAFIAWRTGEARGYFLVGIVTSFGYAAAFGISLIVRKPLVGYVWDFLEPSPRREVPWLREPILLRAYSWATFAGFLLFAARAAVQTSLFASDRTGWLAVARLGMGYPMYIAVLAFAFWVCRRAHRALEDQVEHDRELTVPGPL
ncbi:MAG: hypothetical protein JWN61_2404 [Pseudonocardiales bacterium]|nr:hypothetical protein [Pseudonocardiales bacterium]